MLLAGWARSEAEEGQQTFDSWIVLVDKDSLNELNGQAGLSDTTAADNNELVLAQELYLLISFWSVDSSQSLCAPGESFLPWTPLLMDRV